MTWMTRIIDGHSERRGYHLIADRFARIGWSEGVGHAGSALRAAIGRIFWSLRLPSGPSDVFGSQTLTGSQKPWDSLRC
jgi:hypothetical protein